MLGVVLAAGKSFRFSQSVGSETFKPLVKINNKTLLSLSFDNLIEAGVNEVVIVVSKNSSDVYDIFGNEYRSLKLNYVTQESPVGLINALYSALPLCDGDIILQLSDEVFINPDIKNVIACFDKKRSDFAITYTVESDENRIRNNFSISVDDGSRVVKCVEKPTEIINNLKGTGFCIFSRFCLDYLKEHYSAKDNTPDTLCDFINELIAVGRKGIAVRIADEEININTQIDYAYAQKFFTKEG